MPVEYLVLIFMTLFYLLAWLPASVAKKKTYGMKWLAGNRTPIDRPMPEWGQRAERAHQNLKDYFPGFVVAVILLGLLEAFSFLTSWLCLIFLLSRSIHMASYIAGKPMIRAGSWFLSMICLFALLFISFWTILKV